MILYLNFTAFKQVKNSIVFYQYDKFNGSSMINEVTRARILSLFIFFMKKFYTQKYEKKST